MNARQKAIIVLIPGFAASEADSTCIPFSQIFLRNFKEKILPARLIIIAFQYPYTEEKYFWNGIEVHPLHGGNKGNIHRIGTWLKAFRKIKEINRQYHVLGTLCFWLGECALVGKLVERSYQIPSYTWLMGQDARKRNKYQSLIKPSPSRLIALSDSIKDEFSKNYGVSPSHVVPLAIEAEEIETDHIRDIDILAAGSLISLKNYDQLIFLVSQLRSSGHKLNVKLCGNGPLMAGLESLINELGLEGVIELTGEIPNDEVRKMMRRSKLFVHPSSYEGYSTACAEALAAGAHVISYCQPMKKIAEHHHIVNDFKDMVTRTEKLLSSSLDHSSIIPYSIHDSCEKISLLFRQYVSADVV